MSDPVIVNNQAVRDANTEENTEILEAVAVAQEYLVGVLHYDLEELRSETSTRERWWGALAAPNEKAAIESNVDRPFVGVSGNNTWGPAIPVVGKNDDPSAHGGNTYHLHRIAINAITETTSWKFRVLYGPFSLEEAAQAHRWTELQVTASAGHPLAAGGVPLDIRCPELASRCCKCWVQVWNVTNLAEMNFFIGCHGHDPIVLVGMDIHGGG